MKMYKAFWVLFISSLLFCCNEIENENRYKPKKDFFYKIDFEDVEIKYEDLTTAEVEYRGAQGGELINDNDSSLIIFLEPDHDRNRYPDSVYDKFYDRPALIEDSANGNHFMNFVVKPQPFTKKFKRVRTELCAITHKDPAPLVLGDEFYIRFDLLVGPDTEPAAGNNNYVIIIQLEQFHPKGGVCPPFSLEIDAGPKSSEQLELKIIARDSLHNNNNGLTLHSFPIDKNEWQTFVFNIKTGIEPNSGKVRMWHEEYNTKTFSCSKTPTFEWSGIMGHRASLDPKDLEGIFHLRFGIYTRTQQRYIDINYDNILFTDQCELISEDLQN